MSSISSYRARFVVGVLSLCCAVAPARDARAADSQQTPAQAPSASAEQPDLRLHLLITAVGLVSWSSTALLFPSLNPSSCRWCDRNANGVDTLDGFDSSVRQTLRWTNPHTADVASSVFSFGLAPLAGIGLGYLVAAHDSRLSEFPPDILVVAESAVIAMNLNQVAKLSFARERPYVHARSPSERVRLRSNTDDLSFFSGHATLAFALATSAGTVASLRHYRLAPLMWTVGMALAATGSYLRIAADEHYATDVLTGVAVGAGVGFSVPYFAHRRHGAMLALLPGPGSVSLIGTW